MNLKTSGLVVLMSGAVALGGATSTSLASTHPHAATSISYGCGIDPNQAKCKHGVGGTRVTGGTGGSTGRIGGTRRGGSGAGSGKNGANGNSKAGVNGGANANGANGNGGGTNGAGANGSSPTPSQGLPVTGYGGTAQDLGASPRTAAAGTQPIVAGLASVARSQRVTALPATGGGVPSQPASPMLALIAAALAVLGLGLRTVARRF